MHGASPHTAVDANVVTDSPERTLERLRTLVRQEWDLVRMPADERPVTLTLFRRAVFSAYRAAVRAGVEAEALRILRGAAPVS